VEAVSFFEPGPPLYPDGLIDLLKAVI